MKIRQGFVSNSSSSSFVICGRRSSIEEIDNENVKIFIEGYGEGSAYDRPSREQIKWLKENSDELYRIEFFHEYFSFSEEIEISFNGSEEIAMLAKMALSPSSEKILFKSFERDQHFPDTVEDLISCIE